MGLTPVDIYNKEFSKVLRGYSQDEVDEFLDDIIEEFERLYKENQDMKEKLETFEGQIGRYKTIEDTLKETLVTAQQTAEEVIETGERKADLIIDQAEDRANKIIEDANRQVIEIKKEYENVKKQMQIFKNKCKTLLNTQLELLDDKELKLDDD